MPVQIFPLGGVSQLFYAGAAVVVLTGINILGVKSGKWTQNILTLTKICGMLAIIVVGFSAPALRPDPIPSAPPTWGGLDLALILVMFTFGGWNEMAYVAAEIKNPRRNIVRGLVAGTTAVTVLYLLINGAFLAALGPGPMAASKAVAVDATARVFPVAAGRAIAVLICISALGAVNGLIFTGARISYALGADQLSLVLSESGIRILHPRLGPCNPGCPQSGDYSFRWFLFGHYYLQRASSLVVFPGHRPVCLCPAPPRT